jgi:Copper binding proteins, plastocyanin/azurin family
MKRILLAGVAIVAILSVAVSVAIAAPQKLLGTDGPGFTISMKAGGKSVKALKKGTYSLTVNDKSSIHNFVLEGPGIDRAITTVSGTGSKTVTIKLRAGKYKFYCKPHESSMFGFITVS